MSRTSAPVSRSFAAVPPVETNSIPWRARPAASSSRPLLSEREMSARRTGTRSVISILLSAGAAELPGDFAAQCRNFADDRQLRRRCGCPRPSIHEAFLDRQHRRRGSGNSTAAPRERRIAPIPSAVLVASTPAPGGSGRQRRPPRGFSCGPWRSAGRRRAIPCRRCRASGCACGSRPKAADIAVVAGLDAARVIVLAALDGDVLDAFAERAVGEDVVELVSARTSVLCAAVVRSAWTSSSGRSVGSRPGPAAIDDQPLRAVGHLERQGRGGAGSPSSRRRRRGIEHQDGAERGQPLIAPAARLRSGRARRPQPSIRAVSRAGFAGIAALPARQRRRRPW